VRIRYFRNTKGGLQAKARVYDNTEHNIDPSLVDRDASAIVKRLVSHGFTAYIVGGAVRDLLLGKRPKDFDIVTDALPEPNPENFQQFANHWAPFQTCAYLCKP